MVPVLVHPVEQRQADAYPQTKPAKLAVGLPLDTGLLSSAPTNSIYYCSAKKLISFYDYTEDRRLS